MPCRPCQATTHPSAHRHAQGGCHSITSPGRARGGRGRARASPAPARTSPAATQAPGGGTSRPCPVGVSTFVSAASSASEQRRLCQLCRLRPTFVHQLFRRAVPSTATHHKHARRDRLQRDVLLVVPCPYAEAVAHVDQHEVPRVALLGVHASRGEPVAHERGRVCEPAPVLGHEALERCVVVDQRRHEAVGRRGHWASAIGQSALRRFGLRRPASSRPQLNALHRATPGSLRSLGSGSTHPSSGTPPA